MPYGTVRSRCTIREYLQELKAARVNDMGGTLINESISTAAGAGYGQMVRPTEFRRLIRDANRIPAERTTTTNGIRGVGRRDRTAYLKVC